MSSEIDMLKSSCKGNYSYQIGNQFKLYSLKFKTISSAEEKAWFSFECLHLIRWSNGSNKRSNCSADFKLLKQIKMGESVLPNISKSYSIESLIKSMVNDDEFSDIVFIVGEEKRIIKANKTILRLGSPVFDK